MRRARLIRHFVSRPPHPQGRIRRVSRGASPEWYGASLLVGITVGSILVGFTDTRFVVGWDSSSSRAVC